MGPLGAGQRGLSPNQDTVRVTWDLARGGSLHVGTKRDGKGSPCVTFAQRGATSGSAMRGTSGCKVRDEEASLERKQTVLDEYKSEGAW